MQWLGVALLAFLASDVFFTVFHPHTHGGPLTQRQNRLVWRGLAGVSVRMPDEWRRRLLSLGGPSLAVLSMLAWGVMLLLGFALIYFDSAHLLRHVEVPAQSRWWSAVYYSGYVGSTLGLGDVIATRDWLRVVTVGQAFTGFMLVSVVVSYTLALYRAENESEACAMDLAIFLGDDQSPGAPGIAHLERLDRLDRWAEGQSRRFSSVITSFAQYPVLHYSRPPDARQSLVVQVGRFLRLIEAVEDELAGDLSDYPALDAFRRGIDVYLAGASHQFTRRKEREDDGTELATLRRERHESLMRQLGYRESA